MHKMLKTLLLVSFVVSSLVSFGSNIDKTNSKTRNFESEFHQLKIPDRNGYNRLGFTIGSRSFIHNWSIAAQDEKGVYFIYASDPTNNRIVYLTMEGSTKKSPYILKQFSDEYGDDLNIKWDNIQNEQGQFTGLKYRWVTYINRKGIVKIIDLISGKRNILFKGPVKRHLVSLYQNMHYFIMSDGIYAMAFGGNKVAKLYDGFVKNPFFRNEKLVFINGENRLSAILKDGTITKPPFDLEKVKTFVVCVVNAFFTDMNNDLFVMGLEQNKKFLIARSVTNYFADKQSIYIEKNGKLEGKEINQNAANVAALPWNKTNLKVGHWLSRPGLGIMKDKTLKYYTYNGRIPNEITLLEQGKHIALQDTNQIMGTLIHEPLPNTPVVATFTAKVGKELAVTIASNAHKIKTLNKAIGKSKLIIPSSKKLEIKIENIKGKIDINKGITQIINANTGQISNTFFDHGGPRRPGLNFYLKEQYSTQNGNGNLAQGGKVNMIDDTIYFININGQLMRFNTHTPKRLENMKINADKNLIFSNGELFFLNDKTLKKISKSNNQAVSIKSNVKQFCSTNNSFIFISSQDNSMHRIKHDGSESILVNKASFSHLNVYNGLIYALSPYNKYESRLFVYNPLTKVSEWHNMPKASKIILASERVYYLNKARNIMSILAPRIDKSDSTDISEGTIMWDNEPTVDFTVANNILFSTKMFENKTCNSLLKVGTPREKGALSIGPIIKGIESSKASIIGPFMIYIDMEKRVRRLNLIDGVEY